MAASTTGSARRPCSAPNRRPDSNRASRRRSRVAAMIGSSGPTCSDTSSMAGCVDNGASQPANTSRGYPVTVTVAAHTPPTCTARDATRMDSGSNRPRCLARGGAVSVPASVCFVTAFTAGLR